MTDVNGASGNIPQSSALVEASPDSLSELMSRDPEGYTRQDLDRIITVLREQRVRWQAAEAAGTGGRSAAAKANAKATSTKASLGDLGL